MEDINIWIEIITNGGITGVAIFAAVVFYRRMAKRHDEEMRYLKEELDELQKIVYNRED